MKHSIDSLPNDRSPFNHAFLVVALGLSLWLSFAGSVAWLQAIGIINAAVITFSLLKRKHG